MEARRAKRRATIETLRELGEANRDTLRQIMREHHLERSMVAALLAPTTIHAVRAWLNTPTSKNSHPCPTWAVELLLYKLEDPAFDHLWKVSP